MLGDIEEVMWLGLGDWRKMVCLGLLLDFWHHSIRWRTLRSTQFVRSDHSAQSKRARTKL